MADVDLALIVTEPRLSGIHDTKRVGELIAHFGIPAAAWINKADINEQNTQRIRAYGAQHGLDIVGELPYDETVTEVLAEQISLVEYQDGPVTQGLRMAWGQLEHVLNDWKASELYALI